MRYWELTRAFAWGALVVGVGASGCTMKFPDADSEGTFACKSDKDCLSGYACVEGFCSATGGGGGDPGGGGGDSLLTGDEAGVRFNLSVTRAGVGAGTVTSLPAGINCGTTCGYDFLDGTVVTLTGAPAVGSRFAGWQGACTGVSVCQVTMSVNRTVTAEFVLDTARPVVNVLSGAGTVTGGDMRLDFQVGGGLEAKRVADPTNRNMEAGPGLQPKQER